MPRGTPFHSRTSALCESYNWRNWSGFVCASSYQLVPEMEYHAIRGAAGLLDVSPLFKYHVHGKDAFRLLNQVVTRDLGKCRPHQIMYTPWCDDRGKTIDDGTVWNLGDGTWRIGAQRVEVGQDANVTTLNAEIGAAISKVGMDVRMTGKGGTSRLLGLLAAGDAQRVDFNSCQDLLGSHTTSDLLYLSALYGESRAAFYGVTRVRPEAKQTSSYQECRNLLLSPKAGAEPIPVLEIETNDILRCGHGATAGAIDPIVRFYAMSRGMSEDAAERMIVRGFFERVVAQIDSEPIKARILHALAPRIGETDEVAA